MKDQRKKIIESPSQNQVRKTKRNQNLIFTKFLMGVPLFCIKVRGVVGVPTNGDMLGEAVISVYLPEGYRYRKIKSRFSENIKFHTT